MKSTENNVAYPTAENIGRKVELHDAVHEYAEFLKKTVQVDFKGLKVAVDCANGASYISAPAVLTELGAEIVVIHNNVRPLLQEVPPQEAEARLLRVQPVNWLV